MPRHSGLELLLLMLLRFRLFTAFVLQDLMIMVYTDNYSCVVLYTHSHVSITS